MTSNDSLIDRVIDQILVDIQSGDITAIEELLNHIPENILVSYLPGEY